MNSVSIRARTGTVGESLCPRPDSRSCLRLRLEGVVELVCGFVHREDVRWFSKKGQPFHINADCTKTTQWSSVRKLCVVHGFECDFRRVLLECVDEALNGLFVRTVLCQRWNRTGRQRSSRSKLDGRLNCIEMGSRQFDIAEGKRGHRSPSGR